MAKKKKEEEKNNVYLKLLVYAGMDHKLEPRELFWGAGNVLYIHYGGGLLKLIKLYASCGCSLLFRSYMPVTLA